MDEKLLIHTKRITKNDDCFYFACSFCSKHVITFWRYVFLLVKGAFLLETWSNNLDLYFSILLYLLLVLFLVFLPFLLSVSLFQFSLWSRISYFIAFTQSLLLFIRSNFQDFILLILIIEEIVNPTKYSDSESDKPFPWSFFQRMPYEEHMQKLEEVHKIPRSIYLITYST